VKTYYSNDKQVIIEAIKKVEFQLSNDSNPKFENLKAELEETKKKMIFES